MTPPRTKPEEAKASAPQVSFVRRLVERGQSFLLGDDLFISYSRADSTNYAAALADRLSERGFICYLDQYETAIGTDLPERLQRRLRRSTVFLLIGSPEAVASQYVRQEVEIFKTTERPIIPIDVDGAFLKSEYSPVRGLPHSIDVQPVAETGGGLSAARPAQTVINRITASYKYTRRTQWQRRLLTTGTAFLLISVALALYFSYRAIDSELKAIEALDKLNEAQAKMGAAERARLDAKQQQAGANLDKLAAEREAAGALARAASAQKAARDADIKAGAAAVRARVALQTAADAEASAAAHKRIASSLDEVNSAARLINDMPDRALAASARAYDAAPHLIETHHSLLSSLLRYPHLKSVKRQQNVIGRMAAALNGEVIASTVPNQPDLHFHSTRRGCPDTQQPNPEQESVITLACLPNGGLCATTGPRNIALWHVTMEGDCPSVRPGPVMKRDSEYEVGYDSIALVSPELLVTDDYPRKQDLLFWNPSRPEEPPTRLTVEGSTYLGPLAAHGDEGNGTLALAARRGDRHGVFLWKLDKLNDRPRFIEISYGPTSEHGSTHTLSFSPDGKVLAAGTTLDWLILIDVGGGARHKMSGAGWKVDFLRQPSSRKLASVSRDGKITLWDVQNVVPPRDHVLVEDYKPGARAFVFLPGPDSGTIATAGDDGSITFWHASDQPLLGSKSVRYPEELKPPGVDYVSFDESGRHLLTALPGQQVLREVAGDRLNPLPRNTPGADDLLFHPYAREATIEKPLMPTINPRSFGVEARQGKGKAAVSRDQKTLAVINRDNEVVLWNVSGGKKAIELWKLPGKNPASCVAFGGAGGKLAVGYSNGEVVLWDIAARRMFKTFHLPLAVGRPSDDTTVTAVALSGDGSALASSSKRSPVTLWDVATGNLIGRLEKSQDRQVDALAFSRDGRRLVSVRQDGLTLWDTDPSSWVRRARALSAVR